MYHHISKKTSALGAYVITPEQFESDLKFIKDKGYEAITTQNLVDYFDGKFELPEKPIMITFDDGYLSFYEYAYPLLKQYNMKAVFEQAIDEIKAKAVLSKLNVSFEIDVDTLEIEFDKKKISTGDIISNILSIGTISDFNVTGSSLENMIYDIYTTKKEDLK